MNLDSSWRDSRDRIQVSEGKGRIANDSRVQDLNVK